MEEFPDNGTDESVDEVNEQDDDQSTEEKNKGDSEELIQQRIQFLKEDIQQGPYNFSSYVDLIKILRDKGELHEVRALRETLSSLFPLTEDLWLEWLRDEQRIAATEEEELSVISLYERAIQDYLSVNLWLQWTQWQEKLGEEKNTLELVRQRYEQALTHTGLHLAEGHRVWEAYIKFEKGLQENMEDNHSQQERIRKVYQRSLSIPLKQMEDRMNDYKSWEASLGNEAHVCTFMDQYNSALQAYKERTQFEDIISDSLPNSPDYAQLDKWWEYIRFEEEKNDISRVRCLYERAIKNYFLVVDLWTSYIKYLQTNMKNVSKVILSVCARSVRNWPYTHRLWCTYLQELERAKRPISEINQVFDRGLVHLSTEEDICEIFNQYIDLNARALHNSNQNTNNDEKPNLILNLRAACSRSVDYFTQSFPNSPNLENLTRHWALLEGELIKDSNASQRLFETLFKNHSKRAEYWIDSVRIQKTYMQYNQCRNLFKRACNVVSTDPQSIWTEWKTFERIHGTLEDYLLASERIETRQQEVSAALAAQLTSTAAEDKTTKKKETPKNRRELKDRTEIAGDNKKKPFLKRKQEREEETFNSKRQKNVLDQALPKGRPKLGRWYDSRTVHVSNLPDTTTKEKLKEIFETIGPVVDVRFPPSKFKGFAYVEFEKESDSARSIAKGADKTPEDGIKYDDVILKVAPAFAIRPGTVVAPTPPPPVVSVPKRMYNEELTLFVNNLAYTTTEEELEAAMKPDETVSIKQVRLVRDQKSGRSKGFAYVQFNDMESLEKGLTANGKILHNFTMRVAISKPPTKTKTEDQEMDVEKSNEEKKENVEKSNEEKKENIEKGVKKEDEKTFTVPKRLMPRVVKKQVGALPEKGNKEKKEKK